MEKDYLILKRASASRLSGEGNEDDFDVLCDGVVVGRIMKAAVVPLGMSWMWTLAFGYHEDRTPTHGYEPTCEAAMAAFAKSWRRGPSLPSNAKEFALFSFPSARPNVYSLGSFSSRSSQKALRP